MTQADWIRTYVRDNCIEPARGRGERFVTMRAGDVAKAMRLQDKLPAIGGALRARKFEPYANVILVDEAGPHQGSNLYLTFALLGAGSLDWDDYLGGRRLRDRITAYVRDRYISPARQRKLESITIGVARIVDELGLRGLQAVAAAVLRGRWFQTEAGVGLLARGGAEDYPDVELALKVSSYGGEVEASHYLGRANCWRGRRPETVRRAQGRVDKLIAHFDRWVGEFDRAGVFTGPSIYFHVKAIHVLMAHSNPLDALEDDTFWDLLYATLASWGMHRMGPGGAKLRPLGEIKSSFRGQGQAIEALQLLTLQELSESQVAEAGSALWEILRSLRVGTQETILVVNSKALHHVLPRLMPPIDRQYVLKFFYNNPNTNPVGERVFREIYSCYYRIACEVAPKFGPLLGRGMHTSETKIIDNAIVGYVLAELK